MHHLVQPIKVAAAGLYGEKLATTSILRRQSGARASHRNARDLRINLSGLSDGFSFHLRFSTSALVPIEGLFRSALLGENLVWGYLQVGHHFDRTAQKRTFARFDGLHALFRSQDHDLRAGCGDDARSGARWLEHLANIVVHYSTRLEQLRPDRLVDVGHSLQSLFLICRCGGAKGIVMDRGEGKVVSLQWRQWDWRRPASRARREGRPCPRRY